MHFCKFLDLHSIYIISFLLTRKKTQDELHQLYTPLQCSLLDFCKSAGVQKVPSRFKKNLGALCKFSYNASIFLKKNFHQPFLVNDLEK